MNAIDRNLMFGYEVTDNGVSHVLRALNARLPAYPGISFHFYDVTLLSLQLGRDLIEGVLCFGIEGSLTGTEANFGVADSRILIEPGDSRVQLTCLSAGILGERLRLPCSGVGSLCGLVRLVSCSVPDGCQPGRANRRP